MMVNLISQWYLKEKHHREMEAPFVVQSLILLTTKDRNSCQHKDIKYTMQSLLYL
jgi:hypothetical protein